MEFSRLKWFISLVILEIGASQILRACPKITRERLITIMLNLKGISLIMALIANRDEDSHPYIWLVVN